MRYSAKTTVNHYSQESSQFEVQLVSTLETTTPEEGANPIVISGRASYIIPFRDSFSYQFMQLPLELRRQVEDYLDLPALFYLSLRDQVSRSALRRVVLKKLPGSHTFRCRDISLHTLSIYLQCSDDITEFLDSIFDPSCEHISLLQQFQMIQVYILYCRYNGQYKKLCVGDGFWIDVYHHFTVVLDNNHLDVVQAIYPQSLDQSSVSIEDITDEFNFDEERLILIDKSTRDDEIEWFIHLNDLRSFLCPDILAPFLSMIFVKEGSYLVFHYLDMQTLIEELNFDVIAAFYCDIESAYLVLRAILDKAKRKYAIRICGDLREQVALLLGNEYFQCGMYAMFVYRMFQTHIIDPQSFNIVVAYVLILTACFDPLQFPFLLWVFSTYAISFNNVFAIMDLISSWLLYLNTTNVAGIGAYIGRTFMGRRYVQRLDIFTQAVDFVNYQMNSSVIVNATRYYLYDRFSSYTLADAYVGSGFQFSQLGVNYDKFDRNRSFYDYFMMNRSIASELYLDSKDSSKVHIQGDIKRSATVVPKVERNVNRDRNQGSIRKMQRQSTSNRKSHSRNHRQDSTSKHFQFAHSQGLIDWLAGSDVTDAIRNIGSLAAKADSMAGSTASALQYLHELSSSKLDFILKYKRECASVVLTCVILYAIYSGKAQESTKWRRITIMSGALLLFINYAKVYSMFAELYSCFDDVSNFHGLCSEDSAVQIISALILTISGKIAPKDFTVKSICATTFGFARSFSDMKSFVEVFIKAAKYISELYFTKFLQIPLPTLFFTENPKLQSWLDSVQEILVQRLRGELIFNARSAEKVYDLEYEGMRLMKILAGNYLSRGLVESMKKPLSQLSSIMSEMIKKGVFKKGVRMEPLALIIRGPSGIGKSRMTLPFIHELTSSIIDDCDYEKYFDDPDSFVYFRMPEQQFWDGYDPGKFVTVYDDFGQESAQSVGDVCSALELIRIINNFETPLHMADLSEKSNTRFNSKIVVASTNLQGWPTGGIVEPEALVRRFDFEVTLDLKDEFRQTKDNIWGYGSNVQDDGCDPLNPDMYVFRLKNGATYSWREFLQVCRKRYNLKKARYYKMLNDIPSAMDRGAQVRAQMSNQPSAFVFDPTDDPEVLAAYEAFNSREQQDDANSTIQEAIQSIKSMFLSAKKMIQGFWLYVKKKISDMKLDALWDLIQMFNIADYAIIGTLMYYLVRFAYGMLFPGPEDDDDDDSSDDESCTTEDDVLLSSCEVAEAQNLMDHVNSSIIVREEERDECMLQIRTKVLTKNFYNIISNTGQITGSGVFVKEDFFLVPAHYVLSWRDIYMNEIMERGPAKFALIVRLQNPITRDDISFDVIPLLQDCIVDNYSDTALLRLRNVSQLKPDIVHFFVNLQTFGQRLVVDGDISIQREGKFVHRSVRASVQSTPVLVQHANNVMRKLHDTIRYASPTRLGDCGSLFMLREPSSRCEKILGFHVAGNGTHGYSVFLSQDYILELVARQQQVNAQFRIDKAVKFKHVGTIPRSPGRAVSTSLRPSPLYEMWGPHVKEPAALRPFKTSNGERIDPYTLALSNYDRIMERLPDDQVRLSVSLAMKFIFDGAQISDVDKGQLTYDEAVCGIDGEPYIDGIDRSTSLGYPLCLKGYGSGKKYFLGEEGPVNTTTPEYLDLKTQYTEWELKMLRQEKPEALFISCLKDELRPIEKVKSGKTRMFFSVPVFLLIAFKKYFGRPCAFMMKDRIRNSMTPGINVYGAEWDQVARFFGYEGGSLVDGDIKGFDTTQRSAFHKFIGERWIQVFSNGDIQVDHARRTLWEYVLSPQIIVNSDIYEVADMMVSGMVVTLLLNCMYCASLLCYCALTILEWDRDAPQLLRDNFRFQVNGDDHVFLCGDKIKDKINYFSMFMAMMSIGIEYTPGDKNSTPVESKKLTEITYLKRQFRFEPKFGKYVAPLSMVSILEMPYWSRKGEQYFKIATTNVDRAILELSLHGKDVFEEWAPKLVKASMSHLNHTPLRTDWDDCIDFTYTDGAWQMLKQTFVIEEEIQFQSNCQKSCQIIYGAKYIQIPGQVRCTTGIQHKKSVYLDNHTGRLSKPLCTWTPPYLNGCSRGRQTSPASTENHSAIGESLQITNDAAQVENLATTTFDTTQDQHTNQATGIPRLSKSLMQSTDAITQQDIKTFLGKPMKLTTQLWTPSATQNSTLWGTTVPDSLISVPIFRNKLSGFLGFKATFVCKVQLNANKFQQGRLLLAFIPQAQQQMSNPVRRASLVCMTQLPNVQLDAACDSEVTLRVPYTSPYNYYDLTSGSGSHGFIYLVVYSPLKYGTGTPNAEFTVWGHFEDVEMVGATIPQAGGSSATVVKKGAKTVPSEKEHNAGPLSTVLKQASKGFDAFSDIPMLSAFTAPASWVTGAMSGAAAAFGWSKPNVQSEPHRMLTSIFPYSANVDGVDASQKLGLSGASMVTTLDVSGIPKDEMSFKYIAQIPSYFSQLEWSTSVVTGAVLLQRSMHPYNYAEFTSTDVDNGFYSWFFPPPFVAICQLFNYYRYSLKLTFKVVKTQYHTGRLMITYVPGWQQDLPPYSSSNSQYALREIIDISEGNEFTIVLPYMSTRPWQKMGTPDDANTQSFSGRWYVEVLNALQCPDTVTNSVTVLMEVAACDDFEVAFPEPQNNVRPFIGLYPEADVANSCTIVEKVIGSAQYSNDGSAPTEYCIGEQITSARQLLKRFVPCWRPSASPTVNNISFRPFTISVSRCQTGDTGQARVFADNDYISYFGCMFAYNRGSVRYKILASNDSSEIPLQAFLCRNKLTSPYSVNIDQGFDKAGFVFGSHVGAAPGLPSRQCSLEFEVPQYHVLHSRLNQVTTPQTNEPTGLDASDVRVVVDAGGVSTLFDDGQGALLRAAGEDYSLHMFVSTLPIMYKFTTD